MATLSEEENIEVKVKELLTCPVCLELLENPRTLMQCLHNYCEKCTHNLASRDESGQEMVVCPVCGTMNLPKDISKNQLVEDLLKATKSANGEDIKCEQCNPDNPADAKWRCLDCCIMLCESCRSQHLRIPVLKGHRIVEGADNMEVDNLIFCSMHSQTPVNLYCRECDEIICHECHVDLHQLHNVVKGSTVIDDRVISLQQMLPTLDSRIDDVQEELQCVDNLIKKTKDSYCQSRQEVTEAAAARIAEIQAEEDRLTKALSGREKAQVGGLEMTKCKLRYQEGKFKSFKTVAHVILNQVRGMSLLNSLQNNNLPGRIENSFTEPIQLSNMSLIWPNIHKDTISTQIFDRGHILGITATFDMETPDMISTIRDKTGAENPPDWEEIEARNTTEWAISSHYSCPTSENIDSYENKRKLYIKLQHSPLSKQRPEDLPNIPDVILDQPRLEIYLSWWRVSEDYMRPTPLWAVEGNEENHYDPPHITSAQWTSLPNSTRTKQFSLDQNEMSQEVTSTQLQYTPQHQNHSDEEEENVDVQPGDA